MIFTCWLTKEDIRGPCPVRSCMWWSTNDAGCMANPEPPDYETLTDAALAKHKGLLIPELINARMTAQRRIKSLLVLESFLDWSQGIEHPWRDGYNDSRVIELVTRLCDKHWPYSVHELGWRVRHIALSLHRPTVTRFIAEVGKNVNWLETIELCAEEVHHAVKIFKTAARKQNGKDRTQISRPDPTSGPRAHLGLEYDQG